MRKVILEKQDVLDSDGKTIGSLIYWTTDEDIVRVLTNDGKDPIPTTNADKKDKLKKAGWKDEHIAVLEKEGLI